MVTSFFPLAGQLPSNWKNNCNLLSACVWIEKWARRPKYSKKSLHNNKRFPQKRSCVCQSPFWCAYISEVITEHGGSFLRDVSCCGGRIWKKITKPKLKLNCFSSQDEKAKLWRKYGGIKLWWGWTFHWEETNWSLQEGVLFLSFHLFGLCSSAAWEHRPPITLQALKQQHPPNTTHLGSSIKHPVSWFTFINFLALERPTSSGYLLPGQLCPPNKQPHTRTGATQNGLRVPETTQVEEPWAADSGTAGPAEHK